MPLSVTLETALLQSFGGLACLASVFIAKAHTGEYYSDISSTLGDSTLAASVFSVGIILNALPWFQSQRQLVTNANDHALAFDVCRYAEFDLLLVWLGIQQYSGAPNLLDTIHTGFVNLWVGAQYITLLLIVTDKSNSLYTLSVLKLVCAIPLTVWLLMIYYYNDDKHNFLLAENILLSVYLVLNIPMTWILNKAPNTAANSTARASHSKELIYSFV